MTTALYCPERTNVRKSAGCEEKRSLADGSALETWKFSMVFGKESVRYMRVVFMGTPDFAEGAL